MRHCDQQNDLSHKQTGKNGTCVDFTLGKVAYKLIVLKGGKKGEFRLALEATTTAQKAKRA